MLAKLRSHIFLILALLLGGAAIAYAQTPGGAGLGDPYFPLLGNSGYDVQHYSIDAAIDPAVPSLHATTTIEAQATQDLSAFNLDFNGLQIDSAEVNAAPATFSRSGGELTLTPSTPLKNGDPFTVAITYEGTPGQLADPTSFASLGWIRLNSGIAAMGEPSGSSAWFPVNEHPLDKATYSFALTVPSPLVAVANGVLENKTEDGDHTTYDWEMREPMASYLVILAVGAFTEQDTTSPGGTPIRNFFPTANVDDGSTAFERQGDMIDYYSSIFGPYRFDAYGALVVDAPLGFSLETQSIATFPPRVMQAALAHDPAGGDGTIAHEMAHQWFGDSVSLKSWRDIWLNEGFATYASWLWFEHSYGKDVMDSIIDNAYSDLSGAGLRQQGESDADIRHQLLQFAITGDPTVANLFDYSGVYERGALTLHALRLNVGDDAFFNILRTYQDRFKYGNAATSDFIAVAQEVSNQDLGDFFQHWLYDPIIPALPQG